MSDRLLDIFERSGDANLGQTLLRLAGLAELAHRQQAAAAEVASLNQAQQGAAGRGPRPVEAPARGSGRTGAGPAHMEVGQ